MKEYIAIPPTFKAGQWDGTHESARDLAAEIEMALGTGHHCQVTASFEGSRIRSVLEVYNGKEVEHILYPQDWVVVHPNRTIEILGSEAFGKLYYPTGD